MQWNLLPGTTVEADLSQPHAAEKVLHPLFLPGGLMLSQVARLTGLEPYVIQNWVKRGFVSPPERKKYSRRQFCRILVINMLKDALQLEKICKVLSYVNGDLDDESDDLIGDDHFYVLLVDLIGQMGQGPLPDREERRAKCAAALADYGEPFPGARERVLEGLDIILTAYLAARLRQQAEEQIARLEPTTV